nr:protein FAM177A1-like [Pan troglodytes]
MSDKRGFENVELGVIQGKKKVPRRAILFVSDDTMKEYSTDEDEVDGLERKDVLPALDPEEEGGGGGGVKEEEEKNRMSTEAERQYQQNKLQTDSVVQTDQPGTVVFSSFGNLNFEMEGDSEVIMESKQNLVSFLLQNEMTIKLQTLRVLIFYTRNFHILCSVRLNAIIYILNYLSNLEKRNVSSFLGSIQQKPNLKFVPFLLCVELVLWFKMIF